MHSSIIWIKYIKINKKKIFKYKMSLKFKKDKDIGELSVEIFTTLDNMLKS